MKTDEGLDERINNFSESTIGEPLSGVKQKGLAGGATMWQARLVLSTLSPQSAWASRLRTAIRQGDGGLADQILDAIYGRNTKSYLAPAPEAERRPISNTTVLPPCP